jgi:hypothetical protein
LQIKTKIVSCHTADSKPVKQEINSTVILPPLVFPVSENAPASIHAFQFDFSGKGTPKKRNAKSHFKTARVNVPWALTLAVEGAKKFDGTIYQPLRVDND